LSKTLVRRTRVAGQKAGTCSQKNIQIDAVLQALQRTANFIRDGQDLRFSNFVQVPLPLIPMDEQKEIAEYLNKETARIDSIIADITEQIEKLKEYRQSVISEVVTGKVAVE